MHALCELRYLICTNTLNVPRRICKENALYSRYLYWQMKYSCMKKCTFIVVKKFQKYAFYSGFRCFCKSTKIWWNSILIWYYVKYNFKEDIFPSIRLKHDNYVKFSKWIVDTFMIITLTLSFLYTYKLN